MANRKIDMKNKFIILAIIAFCFTSRNCLAQNFDSVYVYAVYMNGSYHIKLDKDLIKNEVEPIVVTSKTKIDAIHSTLTNTVKGDLMKKLKSNQLDIRLSFEFFKNGKPDQTIGVTPYNTMFINYSLYSYDKQRLKHLDEYVEGLSKVLGIK